MHKVYFPGLNGLRLFAALAVVIGHVSHFTPLDRDLGFLVGLLLPSGYDAVSLFFVLSGFLITYLLLSEKQRTGTISVKRFYIRRSLRIFPLYYFIIALCILLVPSDQLPSIPGWISLLLLSAHVAGSFIPMGIFIPFWSLGVEEWFYATWGLLLKRFSLLKVIAVIVVGRVVWAFLISPHFAIYGDHYANNWLIFFSNIRFECMAIGALGAWLVIRRHPALKWVYWMQAPILMWLVVILMLNIEAGILYDVFLAFVFVGLILNVTSNPRSVLKLETPALRALGNVTYGMYAYHFLVTFLIVRVWTLPNGFVNDLLLIGVVVLGVTAVSVVSYRLIEQPFLRFKPYGERTKRLPESAEAVRQAL